jgi:hypothetical protein
MVRSNQEIALKLAHCYLETSSPQECLNLLNALTDTSENEQDRLYLLSIAYRQLKDHQSALDLLLKNPSPNQQQTFEIGLNFFYLKKFSEAAAHFETIQLDPDSHQIYNLSKFYLARIALLNNQPKEAQEWLKSIQIRSDDPLALENAYLKDYVHFKTETLNKRSFFLKNLCL